MSFWLDLLFGNFIGLISMFTLGFILVMAIWYIGFFMKKIHDEDRSSS